MTLIGKAEPLTTKDSPFASSGRSGQAVEHGEENRVDPVMEHQDRDRKSRTVNYFTFENDHGLIIEDLCAGGKLIERSELKFQKDFGMLELQGDRALLRSEESAKALKFLVPCQPARSSKNGSEIFYFGLS